MMGNIGVGEQTSETSKGLTYVVFADMVGYSALSARDEVGTHTMWMNFVDTCLAPVGQRFEANMMRTLGDGCLVSFNNAADALHWCIEVRRAILSDRQNIAPRWPALSMRFGAHACVVIHDNGEIYGDGVNITKRLQERASGDGVLLSEVIHDQLDEENVDFRYLGALKFKNLEDTVSTYEVIFPDAEPIHRNEGQTLPSIAILPFRNLTGNKEYDYFTEGVIDDIIFSLSGLRELQVIARGSTLAFAQKSVDPRDVARILSVRYVLQGTIRFANDTVRLSISFEDAQTGDTIFGELSEFPHRELFNVQDNIVRKIVSRVAPNVRALELEGALRKPADNFTAYQCTLRALDLMRTLKRDDFGKAKVQLDKAMELDPSFVLPIAWAVRWHLVNIGQNWCEDRTDETETARDLAAKAIGLDRQNPLALAAYGHVKSYLDHDYTTALVYFDRARQIGPSHAIVWILSSATLAYLGKGEEAVEHAKRGLELSPNDYELFQFYDFLSFAYICCENFEEGLVWAKLSRAENPNYTSNLRQLIVCNSALGEDDQAKIYVEELLKLDPSFNLTNYRSKSPFQHQSKKDMFVGHLESAGLPK